MTHGRRARTINANEDADFSERVLGVRMRRVKSTGRMRHGVWGLCALLASLWPSGATAQENAEQPASDQGQEGSDQEDAEEPGAESAQGQDSEEGDEAEELPDSSSEARPSPLSALIGARLYSRAFSYTDALWELYPEAGFREGVGYNLQAGIMPRAQVFWYPGAHLTGSWIAHLGLVAGYERDVGTTLSYAGQPLQQEHSLWFAGIRGRIPVDSVTLGLQANFTSHDFKVSGDDAPNISPDGYPLFPDVTYQQVELGADVEWRNGPMILGAHGSLNIVADEGAIGSSLAASDTPANPWFPNTTATAADFGAYTGWQISKVFDLLAGVDFRAYGLDFGAIESSQVDPNGEAGTIVAGGATDRYVSFWLGLGINWPGVSPAAPEESSPGEAGSSSSDEETEGEETSGESTEQDDDFGDFGSFD